MTFIYPSPAVALVPVAPARVELCSRTGPVVSAVLGATRGPRPVISASKKVVRDRYIGLELRPWTTDPQKASIECG